MVMADLGADVLKIEELGKGDHTRTIHPLVNGESHYFLAINRNKRSVVVDLKSPEGKEIILKLAAQSDVVLENFRPGVMDRLGLNFEALCKVKPDIVMCSISGFGQTGSMRETASFDLVTQAMSGVMHINGEPDGPPTKMGIPMGDIGGGMWAAIGVLAGLQHRNSTGQPLHVDLSLLDGMMGLLGYLAELYLITGESPGRVGSSHHSIVPYGRFEVKDGHIVLALHIGNFWRKFCVAIGREDLIENPKFRTTQDRNANRTELEALVTSILKTRTAAEWHEILSKADVPHGPVNSVGEALEQPVIAERGLVKTVNHPWSGEVKVVGTPLQFPGNYEDPKYAASPILGQDTRSVLEGIGYTLEKIDALVAQGIIELEHQNDGSIAS